MMYTNHTLGLSMQVFTHGQLYVACSRVGNPDNLKFALNKDKDNKVETSKNVVYSEVLLKSQTTHVNVNTEM